MRNDIEITVFPSMRVEVYLYSQSEPVVIENVNNAYTKDGLYCVAKWYDGTVDKFPVQHILRIKEGRTERFDEDST